MGTKARAPGIGAAFFAGLLAALPAARAQDCAPQTKVATLALEPAIDKKEEYVPVTINGVQKLMLLDTGGAMTEVTTEAVDELHLARRHGNFRLYNIYGESSDQFVVGSLEIGPLKAQGVALAVAPGDHVFGEDYELAGVLAPDILKHYDIDVDFGSDTLNLFSPDHCAGKVIYWQPERVAVIPMRVLHSGHIMVQVALDGQPVTAILDTGAYHTTLALPAAETQFGLRVGDKDTPRSGNLTGKPNAFTYHHVFKSLAFEGIAVNNPQVEIIPDLLHQVATDAALPPTGTRIDDPKKREANAAMLIGMSILRHFHIYIAYKEQRLYVTPTIEHPVLPPAAEEPPAALPAHLSLRAER
ncbi:MAG TPA: retroviral-like aspartic protease family protein [Rhizomicrobium sp.]|jgi:predicted aspartyl protease|nr:retroviral-like aspartic protease family protein [Rhizomicrobium sp.]